MLGIDLNTGDMTAGAGKPNGGVAAQGADFEHAFGVDELSLDGEVLALESGDGDGWEALLFGVADGEVEGGVRYEKVLVGEGVDGAGAMEVVRWRGHGGW